MEVRTLSVLLLSGAVAVIVSVVLFEPGSWQYSTALALALFYPSLAIENHERKPASPRKARLVEAVAKLLTNAGYRVTDSPRTGRADVDPFLKTVDLLAQSDDSNLVIEIKSRHQAAEPVEWEAASLLRTAASAMGDALGSDGPASAMQPMLVLVGRNTAPSLDEFSRLEQFAVRVIEDESAIEGILAEDDAEALRGLASEHLGINAGRAPPAGQTGMHGNE
jgi:hypothetical protein